MDDSRQQRVAPAFGMISPAPTVAAADPPVAAPAAASIDAPPQTPGSHAVLDFAALLAAPKSGSPLEVSAAAPDLDVDPDLARSTVVEKITLVLAILLPPAGLIAAIIAATRSARRRGWVIGLLKVAVTLGIVLTVCVGVGGYFGYNAYRQQVQHDQTAAASAAFCATLTKNPTMRELPDFGWPPVGTSIPDSIAAMQSYEDRWTALAAVAPGGIRGDAQSVATSAQQIIDSVTVGRTVDDAANVATMSAVATASGIPAWFAEYCK